MVKIEAPQAGPNRIIIGIDPGSAITGYGVIEVNGPRARALGYGNLKTTASAPLVQRVESLYGQLCEVIQTHHPGEAAMESIFHARNARSALTLGHARGVLLLALAHSGLAVADYAPRTVKQAVTGSGKADKTQVSKMVCLQLHLDSPPPEDACDALAVALTHGVLGRSALRVEGGR